MVDVVGDPDVLEVCTVLFSSLAEVDVQVVQSYRRVAPELQRVRKTKVLGVVYHYSEIVLQFTMNNVVLALNLFSQIQNRPFSLM